MSIPANVRVNTAVAHLRPGDIIESVGTMIPPGTVEEVEFVASWDLPYEIQNAFRPFERSTSHLRRVCYTDGRVSEYVNGARHVSATRP